MAWRWAAGLVLIVAGCGAATTPPAADAGQQYPVTAAATVQTAVDRVNHWRMLAGVGLVADQPEVQAAAQAHLDFVQENPASCFPGLHAETMAAGCTGFTGAMPADRLTHQGYAWSFAGEVMTDGISDPVASVDLWIWDTYHRLLVLDPEATDVGFASGTQYAVLDLAAPQNANITPPSGVIVFPAPQMTGVPTSWQGSDESPTPQAPPNGWPSGPVVSFRFPSNTWQLNSVTLGQTSVSGDSVPITLVTPSTDMTLQALYMQDSAFFYANAPLKSGTSYTVTATGTIDHTAWMQTWSFITAGQP